MAEVQDKMNKAITLFALAFITMFALTSAVSAYHVKVEWTMDQYAYDFEAYRCTTANCSTVDPTPIMSGNTGAASRGIVTEYFTSGTAYHAFYFYKNGYRVNNYIVKTTKEYKDKYWDTFKKKDSCTSTINSVTISPVVLNEGGSLSFSANVQSAFVTPSVSLGMPLFAPPTHTSFFSSDVEVNLTAQNASGIVFSEIRNLNIFESTNMNAAFTIANLTEGMLSLTVRSRITDDQCDLSTAIVQTETRVVNVNDVNNAPVITTSPDTSGTVGVWYNHDVNATDADGDTLIYSLIAAPAGMSINTGTGMISWMPSAAGSFPVNISVSDGIDSVSQAYNLVVTAIPNNAPVITTSPVTTAVVNATYTYDINATDADNNTLTYSLDIFPAGMTINSATGLISWTPSAIGNYTVRVGVSDGIDSVLQMYNITVNNGTGNNTAPTVSITSPADSSEFEEEDVIQFRASISDAEESGLQATWNSSIDGYLGTGNSINRTLSEGTHIITARVVDSGGLSDSYAIVVFVEEDDNDDDDDGSGGNSIGEYINLDGLFGKEVKIYDNFKVKLGRIVEQSNIVNLPILVLMLLITLLLMVILLVMVFKKR